MVGGAYVDVEGLRGPKTLGLEARWSRWGRDKLCSYNQPFVGPVRSHIRIYDVIGLELWFPTFILYFLCMEIERYCTDTNPSPHACPPNVERLRS